MPERMTRALQQPAEKVREHMLLLTVHQVTVLKASLEAYTEV